MGGHAGPASCQARLLTIDRVMFTVLICTCNRHQLLERALRALIEQTIEKPDQVVVVNGGDERADEVVQSFARDRRLADYPEPAASVGGPASSVQVNLVKTVNKNLAASRNVGLPFCLGDIIAMTDDDAEVFPDWVTQMKRLHREHPEAGAVGGPVLAIDRSNLASRLAEKVTFPSWPGPRYIRTLPTVNLSYKAEVIRQVGLQDENMWTGEDVDYNWRMIKLGHKVYFDPTVRVRHDHPHSIGELWRKHYYYGRGYYMLRRRWQDMYCIYPRRFTTAKDWLKLGNFLAYHFYAPVVTAASMERIGDKVSAWPILVVNQLVGDYGLIVEWLRQNQGLRAR